ncbi:MAG: sigma 54-interacting transcriptional regulator [Thalassobaculales bacterium]
MSLEGRVIGLIEDDPIMGESLVQSLALEGAYVDWWRDGESALKGLKATCPDLVVCDIRLPDATGGEIFRQVCRSMEAPPFMFMTAFGDIDDAVRLMRAGAGDYLTKPFDFPTFLERARALVAARAPACGEAALGPSPEMRRVEAILRKIAPLSSSVLLHGETGVGKEVCARFLHQISPRAAGPLVAVNCAALPGELIESEIFGHERGAFTGAHALHRGYAERAGEGILLLDEISEMPVATQAKLLRLLEERVFTRVGGERPLAFRARLICASNRDLGEAVAAGRFRADLLHRLNTITIEIPPLRQRPADIAHLLEHFFERFAAEREGGPRGFASVTVDAALEHRWAGNARELRNRVERAVALAGGPLILPHDLFPDLAEEPAAGDRLATLSETRDSAERRHILRAMAAADNHPTRAAAILGVARTTLWEKMRRLGIEPPRRTD